LKDKSSGFQLQDARVHWFLLLLWIVIGAGFRLANLTAKAPWTDEFATMVFSLGHTFNTVPLDQAIALDTLMQPLKPDPTAGASAVIDHILNEDTHPPLYFVLVHEWMKLLPLGKDGYISLWAARSLPALFGVVSIPAVYFLSRFAFGSRLVGQLAAAMMAVSPHGIFQAQEARHYSLAIVFVIASLTCLVIAAQSLWRRTPLPIWVALSWVVINSLGIATHYFFILTLCTEVLVLVGLGWYLRQSNPSPFSEADGFSKKGHALQWWRLMVVGMGTVAGGLVWLQDWQHTYGSQQTQWIYTEQQTFLTVIGPFFQALGTWIAMISLLPVESPNLPVVIASGAVMLGFFVWALPILYRGLKVQWQQLETRLGIGILGGVVLGAIVIFFGITYILGIDLTRGARYNFVYFPAVIALVGASLAPAWNNASVKNSEPILENASLPLQLLKNKGKRAVLVIFCMGFLSALTVVYNLGYQKYYRPDFFVPIIQQTSQVPVLIATTHNTLSQTGELMGIGWEFLSSVPPIKPQFLLAHQEQKRCQGNSCHASIVLQQSLASLPRPLDVWLVNFHAPTDAIAETCAADSRPSTPINGYHYQIYHCR
jgi:uncharacterized membrane protein